MAISMHPMATPATKLKVVGRANGWCQFWFPEGVQCRTKIFPANSKDPGRVNRHGQVAHIYSPRLHGPRSGTHLEGWSRWVNHESNLLLLCFPHHQEVDENPDDYPPELLLRWRDRNPHAPDDMTMEALRQALLRLDQESNIK